MSAHATSAEQPTLSALATGKPSFSYSDAAWRKDVDLDDEELTVNFTYQTLAMVAEIPPEIAEPCRRYGEALNKPARHTEQPLHSYIVVI